MIPSLRQLEYLVAIADHGSFHAAARACHVTQPGLSLQIQQLESLLGVQAFERNRPRILVTAAGEALVERARRVLAEAEGLVEAATLFAKPLSGLLTLGAIPTIAPYLLPKALPRVRRRYPELTLRLQEAQTADLVDRVQRGDVDVALLALEADLNGLETEALFRDDFVVAVSSAHPLAGKRSVAESALSGEPVLLLADGHCLRDQALSLCGAAGADELGDFRASSLTTLVQMVASGLGLTLLPQLATSIEGKGRDIRLVPFRKPAPYRTIGLAWRPTSGRAEHFRLLGELLTLKS